MISMLMVMLSSVAVRGLVYIFPWLDPILEKTFETLLNLAGVFPKLTQDNTGDGSVCYINNGFRRG